MASCFSRFWIWAFFLCAGGEPGSWRVRVSAYHCVHTHGINTAHTHTHFIPLSYMYMVKKPLYTTTFDDLYQVILCIIIISGPGTSLRKPPGTASRGISQGIRPLSQSGRPLSGFIRPGTQGSRPKTMEQAIMTPRTAMTARYVGIYSKNDYNWVLLKWCHHNNIIVF